MARKLYSRGELVNIFLVSNVIVVWYSVCLFCFVKPTVKINVCVLIDFMHRIWELRVQFWMPYKSICLIPIGCMCTTKVVKYFISLVICFFLLSIYAYVMYVELCVTTFPQNESLLQVLAMNGYQPTSIKLNTTAPRHQYSNMNRNR